MRVLILDDDPLVRKSLHRTVQRAGFGELVPASTNDEAIAAIQAELAAGRQLDLVLQDFVRAHGDGLDLYHRLRGLPPELRDIAGRPAHALPVVCLSGGLANNPARLARVKAEAPDMRLARKPLPWSLLRGLLEAAVQRDARPPDSAGASPR